MADSIKSITPTPGMFITENVIFEPGVYDFREADGIIIGADNITIDGNGSVITGGTRRIKEKDKIEKSHDEFSYDKDNMKSNDCELGFYGIGIKSEGHSNVVIRNLKVQGFDIGLFAKDGAGWTVQGNDFSDNFTDPDWGWDDHGFHGGILFERIDDSLVIENKATNVWDGINLRYSNRNKIYRNDFSHVSDVCLKLWNACENEIMENDLSYGIRISPGEVHARDSSGVLIESGSNNNVFKKNDITYGGDGIFIRVLNGWMSMGNYFEENDCSFANNNAIEAWAPGNIYVRNKANNSSYGFWLGGSDDTLLLENEVAYNGTNYSNAPESFGNAGIAVVNGSGSHFKVIGNYIHDNNGPGLAIRYEEDYPAYHWIIEKNIIKNNHDYKMYRGHGIYIKNAKWIDFSGNEIMDNGGEAIFIDKNVSDVYFHDSFIEDKAPMAKLTVKGNSFNAGEEIELSALESTDPSGMKSSFRWDLDDGTLKSDSVVKHTYSLPGFYRVGLTVTNGSRCDMNYANIYINPLGKEIGTNENIKLWDVESDDPQAQVFNDDKYFVSGSSSIKLSTLKGVNHILTYPRSRDLNLDLKEKTVSFFIKFESDADTDWERKNKKPVVRLYSEENNYFEFMPEQAYLEQLFSQTTEQKHEWKLLEFNLENPINWTVNKVGQPSFDSINYIRFIVGPSKSALSNFWLDGLRFIAETEEEHPGANIAESKYKRDFPKPISSVNSCNSCEWSPLSGQHKFRGDGTPRWSSLRIDEVPSKDWYGVDFGIEREINRLDIYFYHNVTRYFDKYFEGIPSDYVLEYWKEGQWIPIDNCAKSSEIVQPNLNRLDFQPVITSKLRVVVKHQEVSYTSIYAFEAYNTRNIVTKKDKNSNSIVDISSSKVNKVNIKEIGVILNKEINSNSAPLSSLIVKLYEVKEDMTPGEVLKETYVPREQIIPGKETIISINKEGLIPGKRYAVALTQENLAHGRTEGDYYRWVAGKEGYDECFGVCSDGEIKNETHIWGTGWLRVYLDKYIIDLSNRSEGLGNRLGFTGQDIRWQTFTVKDPVNTLIDGIINPGGIILQGGSEEEWIELDLKKQHKINAVTLHLTTSKIRYEINGTYKLEYFNGQEWKQVDSHITMQALKNKFNKIEFEPIVCSRMRFRFCSYERDELCISEIGILEVK
jgi:parallel beta-helix repeat protein